MLEIVVSSSVIILCMAIILDLLIGDPKWLPHPVIGIGKLILLLEKRWNAGSSKRRKGLGILLTFTVIGTVYVLSFSMVLLAFQLHIALGIFLEAYLIFTTIAINGLREAALRVYVPLSQGDYPAARYQLSMIVGRDTQDLSESEIVRGTVETLAENTVDGITAPLFWAFVGGAPLAMAYRAVNTLDSMVGYKNEKFHDFGWASARLDDIANWLPARITSVSFWLSSMFIKGANRKLALQVTYRDAKKHPSPNGGWSEAMVAGLMGIQLGGINYYDGVISRRAKMGDPLRELEGKDIKKTIVYMHGGWIVFYIILSVFTSII
ncbi:adenosylcobinamide-phosphate synthase CbiB [Salipaludibacillus neizhouensis]|uniref:adenosylcobinamide-phosphate synthase CbiB n=1 Tax=Salipaludibacillus neizhouensis TaxID=885475 RepID=UPI001CBA619A|nr:adenosylcobinamide-phosphate synthase CbiB [Salipaludibacillus neizhouensis]